MKVIDHPVVDYRAMVDDTTQFLDVRRPDEVATGTLPGAVNIAFEDLPSRLADLDPDRRVVLLCRSGRRSAEAGRLLVAEGFTDVVDLVGGMIAYDEAAGRTKQ